MLTQLAYHALFNLLCFVAPRSQAFVVRRKSPSVDSIDPPIGDVCLAPWKQCACCHDSSFDSEDTMGASEGGVANLSGSVAITRVVRLRGGVTRSSV
jgi:hypothetical protein